MAKIRRKIENYHRWSAHVGRRDLTALYKAVSGLKNPAPWYQVGFITNGRHNDAQRHLVRILRAVSQVTPRPVVLGTTFDLLNASIGNGEQRIWYTPDDVAGEEGSASEVARRLTRSPDEPLWEFPTAK